MASTKQFNLQISRITFSFIIFIPMKWDELDVKFRSCLLELCQIRSGQYLRIMRKIHGPG